MSNSSIDIKGSSDEERRNNSIPRKLKRKTSKQMHSSSANSDCSYDDICEPQKADELTNIKKYQEAIKE